MEKKVKTRRTFQLEKSRFGKVETEQSSFLLSEESINQQGQPVQETTYSPDGSEQERCDRSFDSQGRLVEETVHHVLTGTYDKRVITFNDTELTSVEVQFYGDDPGERTLVRYNDKGNVLEIKKHDADGEFESKQVFDYNEKGLPILDEEYNNEDELIKRVITDYDDKGNMSRQQVSFPHEPDEDYVITFSYAHLSSHEEAKATDGALIYSSDFKYNEQGRETEEVREHQFDPSESWRIVSEYDDAGRSSLREHYNGADDLMYRLQFSYADGLVTEEGRFLTAAYVGEARHTIKRFDYTFWD